MSLGAIRSAHEALTASKRLTRSHSAYRDLAVLHHIFAGAPQEQHKNSDETRLFALATYVVNNYRSPSVYDETQSFIDMLYPAEVKTFLAVSGTPLESVRDALYEY